MKHKNKKQKRKWLRLIIILIIIFYFLTGYAKGINLMYDIQRQEVPVIDLEAMSVPELIDYIAPQYGADPELVKKIAFCEASYRTDNVIHDGGRGKGTTGILLNTFNYWKIKLDLPELRYESNYDQLVMMSKAFATGEEYRWAWTSYRAYKNDGTYTFYSSYEHRWITVYCK